MVVALRRKDWLGWASLRDFATWALSWTFAGGIAWQALRRTGSIDVPTGGLVALFTGLPFYVTRNGDQK